MVGKIFDIQRFCIYDGPGIRTNVFFKGCPLRCVWCHNPESQKSENQLMFYRDKCAGCGECARLCANAFTGDCVGCGRCVERCRHDARRISGKEISSDEVVKTVLKDREFYRTSGGGVTLSGGEPLMQIDFAADILKKCRENGIHTAVETAGFVKWERFLKVIDCVDLFLYDIKGIDRENHIKNTGVSNELILENAKKLMAAEKNIRFRMPVVPEHNMREVAAVKAFAGDFPLELMKYHTTGRGKYDALSRSEQKLAIVPPTDEEMEALAAENGAIYNKTGV